MTAATRPALDSGLPTVRPARLSTGTRTVLTAVLIVVCLCMLWEGLKAFSESVGYALDVGGTTVDLTLFNDAQLPHLSAIVGAFGEPSQRGGAPLYAMLFENALYTFWAALRGFAIGGVVGFALAVLFAHSRLLQRGLLPYVVASQTVPILAIAPMVVIWMGRAGALEWSVPIIAAYLTFFPVTIYTLRGLTSVPATALELMHSYAAGWWAILIRLRIPNAMPQIFTALKISATASVVGAIIGELPSGIQNGLGIAILNFSRYYNQSPPRLFATILAAGALGIFFFVIVALAERAIVRWRVQESL
ncbi:MAG: ABC transporter permease [Chloroflexota bacterium]|nr:ABC transporter permease [Chloroflexota bacterium]